VVGRERDRDRGLKGVDLDAAAVPCNVAAVPRDREPVPDDREPVPCNREAVPDDREPVPDDGTGSRPLETPIDCIRSAAPVWPEGA
jgi:hypothetical protein